MLYSFKEQVQQISPSRSFTKILGELGNSPWSLLTGRILSGTWEVAIHQFSTSLLWEVMLDFLITRLENSVLKREPKNFLEEHNKEDGQSGIFFSKWNIKLIESGLRVFLNRSLQSSGYLTSILWLFS